MGRIEEGKEEEKREVAWDGEEGYPNDTRHSDAVGIEAVASSDSAKISIGILSSDCNGASPAAVGTSCDSSSGSTAVDDPGRPKKHEENGTQLQPSVEESDHPDGSQTEPTAEVRVAVPSVAAGLQQLIPPDVQSDILADIMPLPSAEETAAPAAAAQQSPGAYSEAVNHSLRRREVFTADMLRQPSHQPPQLQQLTRHQYSSEKSSSNSNKLTSSGLVIAKQVTSVAHLPLAEELDESDVTYQSRGKSRRNFVLFLAAVAIVTAVVVALLLVFVLRSQDNPSHHATYQPTVQPSVQPSQAPTALTLESYINSTFPEETLRAIAQDPSSPQAMAYEWMITEKMHNKSLLSEGRIFQRFALATFYFATNGPTEWLNRHLWVTPANECLWFSNFGLSVDPNYNETFNKYNLYAGLISAPCNEEGVYRHLWMPRNRVRGELPPEFFWLTNLQSINFEGCDIGGTISGGGFAKLTDLEFFDFQENDLSGTIPLELFNLKNLSVLGLARNPIRGTIPTQVGLATILRSLVFADSPELGGTIPTQVGQLTTMMQLVFRGINLQGTIPSELFLLTTLFIFAIEGNQLSDTLPTQIGKLTKLEQFGASSMLLEGTLPSQLGLVTNIDTLWFGNNQLVGTIPTELGLLVSSGSMEILDLSNNTLSGTVPTELGLSSDAMDTIDLSNNNLSGVIPPELCFTTANVTFDCNLELCGCDCDCATLPP